MQACARVRVCGAHVCMYVCIYVRMCVCVCVCVCMDVWPNISATQYSVLANMATSRTVHSISVLRNQVSRSTPTGKKPP